MPSSLRRLDQRLEVVAPITAPVGLAGLAKSTPLQRLFGMRRPEVLGVQIGGAVELDLDDLEARARS